MENKQKEKFYVFSGIYRTLMGDDFLNYFYGPVGVTYGYLKPDHHSMDALNALLENLEKKYDTKLVITSRKREYPVECEEYLKHYGLKYDKPMFFTPIIEGERGEKIVSFLESQNASPLEYHNLPLYARFFKYFKDNPDFKNYVVLDEKKSDIGKYIPSQQFVAVNHRKGLTMEDAEKIVKAQNIEFTLPEYLKETEMTQE